MATKQPKEWANCHVMLKKALAAAPEAERPPPPYHHGGPQPSCPAAGQIAIAIWCAEALAPTLKEGERADYDRALSLAREFIGAPSSMTHDDQMRLAHGMELASGDPKRYERLLAASRAESTRESPALSCARNAASGSASYCRGKADLVFTAAGAATGKIVKHLAANPGSLAKGRPATVKDLLVWLDEAIVRLECEAAMSERAKKPVPVRRVLWRGADAKGKAAHFLAALEGGRFGVLTKVGSRWALVEGSLDDTLANLPEALFKEAAAAAMSREPDIAARR